MNMIAILLGMSLDVGGVGGLLSGIFAKSFKRAMLWSAGFGALNVVLLLLVSPTSRFRALLTTGERSGLHTAKYRSSAFANQACRLEFYDYVLTQSDRGHPSTFLRMFSAI